jgi:hypothetical protein
MKMGITFGEFAEFLDAQLHPENGTFAPIRTKKPRKNESDALHSSIDGVRALYAHVFVKHRPVAAIIDTGSAHSMVSESFLQDYNLQIDDESPYSMVGIDGQARKPMGMLRGLAVRVAQVDFALDVHIMPNARFSLVIGMDWLIEVGADIVCEERIIHFQHAGKSHSLKTWATDAEAAVAKQQVYDPADATEEALMEEVLTTMFEEEVEAYTTLELDRTIFVPARDKCTWRPAQRVIQSSQEEILIEPAYLELTKHGVIGLPVLVNSEEVGLTLINTSDEDIHLPKGVTVALASTSVKNVEPIRNCLDIATSVLGKVQEVDYRKEERVTEACTVSEGELLNTFGNQILETLDDQLSPTQRDQLIALLEAN